MDLLLKAAGSRAKMDSSSYPRFQNVRGDSKIQALLSRKRPEDCKDKHSLPPVLLRGTMTCLVDAHYRSPCAHLYPARQANATACEPLKPTQVVVRVRQKVSTPSTSNESRGLLPARPPVPSHSAHERTNEQRSKEGIRRSFRSHSNRSGCTENVSGSMPG